MVSSSALFTLLVRWHASAVSLPPGDVILAQLACPLNDVIFLFASGVNFTNILRAAFLYESFLRSFYVLTIWVCIFWQKDFGAKAAHKMLVKLTPRNLYLYKHWP
jgi:hypothetical protein